MAGHHWHQSKLEAVELRSEIEKAKGYVEHLQECESNLPAIQNLKCRIDSFSEDRGEAVLCYNRHHSVVL